MKIGLWLQDHRRDNPQEFQKVIELVKNSDIDLFVFPENAYTSFRNELYGRKLYSKSIAPYFSKAKRLAEYIGKPTVFSDKDGDNTIFSWYYNPNAGKGETLEHIYIKHTATLHSAFDFKDYKEKISDGLFKPIILKGKKIGLTICYDCNHPVFSAMYGAQNIDILINSTGGNVTDDKWHRYNQVRAIENHCFNFVTMGYWEDYRKINSYVYGFNPDGKPMRYRNLMKRGTIDSNLVGTVYVFDTDKDEYLPVKNNSKPNYSQSVDMYIPEGNIQLILDKCKKLEENLYLLSSEKDNVVFSILKDEDIVKPGKVCRLLYNSKLKNYKNKKYIVVSQWPNLRMDEYKEKVEPILRVRSMENFCAVVLESKIKNACFQCGKNRSSQEVPSALGYFGIDLSRTTGPEAIWKNKPRTQMRAAWRVGYEWLIEKIVD